MSDIASARLKKELQEMRSHPDFSENRFSIDTVEDNLFHMKATIAGPPDTPYFDGMFKVDLRMSKKYPFSPPKVRFLTRLWHPNVSSITGCICLDILDNKWAAALTIRGVLLSLQSLLQDPEPSNPLDASVAYQYRNRHDLFFRTASYWTAIYASNDPMKRFEFPDFELALESLRDMLPHESDESLISALSCHNWSVGEACCSLT
ncbi:ubiquitin-conjugating enzyme E2-22 kDa-like [Panonychus citri]|uniref:ubiquitin-conjugating enzyme E2-22 kDa-like n=1 Tax=Panonychus citri TaxID=50023 RepID=UPI0023075244|nr:ubiquitin-conjugating enzyme E2-22 kDa-like [Panonychus citri]